MSCKWTGNLITNRIIQSLRGLKICSNYKTFQKIATKKSLRFTFLIEVQLLFDNWQTQPANDVETTLYGRYNEVRTLKWRCKNVVLTSYAGWERTSQWIHINTKYKNYAKNTFKISISTILLKMSTKCSFFFLFFYLYFLTQTKLVKFKLAI